MSAKEVNRLEVMHRLNEKRLKQAAVAELLGVGKRQVKRLLRRYRQQGASGLVSKRRGRPISRPQIPDNLIGLPTSIDHLYLLVFLKVDSQFLVISYII